MIEKLYPHLIFISLIVGSTNCSFGQDLDSLQKIITVRTDGLLNTDTLFQKTKYNYIYHDSIFGVLAFGNVDEKKMIANGKWVFFYNGMVVVKGKYRKGKQHGKWEYEAYNQLTGSSITYKRGSIKKAISIY